MSTGSQLWSSPATAAGTAADRPISAVGGIRRGPEEVHQGPTGKHTSTPQTTAQQPTKDSPCRG